MWPTPYGLLYNSTYNTGEIGLYTTSPKLKCSWFKGCSPRGICLNDREPLQKKKEIHEFLLGKQYVHDYDQKAKRKNS